MIPQGLSLQPNVITGEKEKEIIAWLDNQTWSTELSRRTQHYGYNYNYKSKDLTPGAPIEGPLLEIAQTIENAGLMKPVQLRDPTQLDPQRNLRFQCIVNEYYRNQGIAPHIDKVSFGPTIIAISIGADVVMSFNRNAETFECFLPQRSMMMMTGSARYEWKHSIPKCVTYLTPEGKKIKKPDAYRRISLTYRELASNTI